ncbi:MAG: hypothetical protein IPP15_21945 [Saprospiraceae bacterium]|uniref:Uncharacterized protein n=1 Tax=Candidatus Opimibacter skivensis TaxID=2982028 RepID=A0A9D7SZ78_9BACT|nr:hypothetical protein [Candidatus Opimibacter skivensis]
MKTFAISIGMLLMYCSQIRGQSNTATNNVIEGSKIAVELIKALTGKKDLEKTSGCKGSYADLCVVNETTNSIAVVMAKARSDEKKEILIQPSSKECFLQIGVGVWTYDLHIPAVPQSLRRGDILIEGCQNLIMTIK